MSGDANLNPQQLSMFMSARELSRMRYADSHGDSRFARAEVRAYKQRDNEDNIPRMSPETLNDWLSQPVKVSHAWPNERSSMMLSEGHHRMIYGMRTDPDRLFAVNHVDEANWH